MEKQLINSTFEIITSYLENINKSNMYLNEHFTPRDLKIKNDFSIVNKGNKDPASENIDTGFNVCRSCGKAELVTGGLTIQSPHNKSYATNIVSGQSSSHRCNGSVRPVFLGHTFTTDLLLIRFQINNPFNTNISDKELKKFMLKNYNY